VILFLVQMEICISNLQKNTSKNYIFNIFTRKRIGLISNIEFVNKLDYKIAFIKFNKFYETDKSKAFLDKINKNIDVYLVYESNWFWKCSIKHKTNNSNYNPAFKKLK